MSDETVATVARAFSESDHDEHCRQHGPTAEAECAITALENEGYTITRSDSAAAPLDVERLAEALDGFEVILYKPHEGDDYELHRRSVARVIAREYAALQASAPNPEERP